MPNNYHHTFRDFDPSSTAVTDPAILVTPTDSPIDLPPSSIRLSMSHACSCNCIMFDKSPYFHQIECIPSAVLARAMIVWTAEVGCTKGLKQSAYHTVQALRSNMPQEQPTHIGQSHCLHRAQALCMVRGGRASGPAPNGPCAASVRSAAALPKSSLSPTKKCTCCRVSGLGVVWDVGLQCGTIGRIRPSISEFCQGFISSVI
jgi:hypothetical protein